MTVSFHPAAESELAGAVEYYEEREPGLGYDFAVEVYATIDRVVAHPAAWPFVDEGIRRAMVRRFPYGILYADQNDNIVVVALMHLHRAPGYWMRRI